MKLFNLSLLFTLIFSYTVPSFAEPSNLSVLKHNVRQYHDSGQYEQEVTEQIQHAKEFLLQQVEYYKTHKTNNKLALVLDIDETSLSNYQQIAKRDFSGDPSEIHKEILAADAPALKATLSLYKTAIEQGIAVFFVTGRQLSELEATKQNLTAAGYKDWAGLFVRPKNYQQKSIIPFKSSRRARIEKQGYIILATIGDQTSDINGGHAIKGFKLPNPYYYIP
jgi:predicted secreted acid phosphatase